MYAKSWSRPGRLRRPIVGATTIFAPPVVLYARQPHPFARVGPAAASASPGPAGPVWTRSSSTSRPRRHGPPTTTAGACLAPWRLGASRAGVVGFDGQRSNGGREARPRLPPHRGLVLYGSALLDAGPSPRNETVPTTFPFRDGQSRVHRSAPSPPRREGAPRWRATRLRRCALHRWVNARRPQVLCERAHVAG